jgi:hypothetical protein
VLGKSCVTQNGISARPGAIGRGCTSTVPSSWTTAWPSALWYVTTFLTGGKLFPEPVVSAIDVNEGEIAKIKRWGNLAEVLMTINSVFKRLHLRERPFA